MGYWAATQVKGLSHEIFIVPEADVVFLTEGSTLIADSLIGAWQGDASPAGSETVARYQRPLGIPALEDKIVQLAIKKILEAIFGVGRKTSSKKFRQKMKAMNLWLKGVRNRMKLELWWPLLVQKMTGHYPYYGISGNIQGLQSFYYHTEKLAFKWINRRSQKKSYN
jgi:hypothetical protein